MRVERSGSLSGRLGGWRSLFRRRRLEGRDRWQFRGRGILLRGRSFLDRDPQCLHELAHLLGRIFPRWFRGGFCCRLEGIAFGDALESPLMLPLLSELCGTLHQPVDEADEPDDDEDDELFHRAGVQVESNG